MELNQFLYLVPVVIGVVQVIKVAGLAKRYIPLVSVLLGVAVATFLAGSITATALLGGAVLGLASSGLWSGVKSTIQ